MNPHTYDSFSTTCPYCHEHDELVVVSFTATSASRLTPDGFEVVGGDTEDVRVQCQMCLTVFDLEEVAL